MRLSLDVIFVNFLGKLSVWPSVGNYLSGLDGSFHVRFSVGYSLCGSVWAFVCVAFMDDCMCGSHGYFCGWIYVAGHMCGHKWEVVCPDYMEIICAD